jgi:hypothetical protein
MAVITGYTSLLATLQSYLARGDLAADVPGFVQTFEEALYRQPKNHGAWMEQELSETIASGVIAVPDDYLNLKNAYIDASPSTPLSLVGLDVMLGTYPRGQATGRPIWMARQRNEFIFGPQADSGYDIKGTYWGKPVVLRSFAADAAAHWLIVNAPDLVLYGSLLQAEPYIKNDSRILTWKTFYADALKDYRDGIEAEKHTMPAGEVLA